MKMKVNDKEIIEELRGIRQELRNMNEKLEDLGYLSQLESINENLYALNPQIQKQIMAHEKLQGLRIKYVSGEISKEEQ